MEQSSCFLYVKKQIYKHDYQYLRSEGTSAPILVLEYSTNWYSANLVVMELDPKRLTLK